MSARALLKGIKALAIVIVLFVGGGVIALLLSGPFLRGPSAGSPQGTATEYSWPISWVLNRLSMHPAVVAERSLVAVQVENQEDARPHQKGMEKASIILEMLVEGGISRFSLVFDLHDLPPVIGPVRSLRPYFLEILEPWAEGVIFAGGSPEALEEAYESEMTMTVNGLGHPKEFFRDKTIPAPHNLFLSGASIPALLANATIGTTTWPPYAIGAAQASSGASVIDLEFGSRIHNVTYRYSSLTGRYERTNGDVVSNAEPSNVLVLEMPITGVGEVGRLTIPTAGDGPLMLFRNGVVQTGTWARTEQQPLRFLAEDGTPLPFARGQTWITILSDIDRVSFDE